MLSRKSVGYGDAGVSIDSGNRLVDRIRPFVKATRRKEILSDLGGFAGLCAIPAGYHEPVLVSSTDGVGTKLRLAFESGRHDTIGVDLVAMNVDDIVVVGAEPLYFLDYFACGKLDVDVAEKVIQGISQGCLAAGCALIGGETAEMPGSYPDGEYDLAGFAVGVVERGRIIDGKNIRPGDFILGLESSGLHSNGYSLARHVLFDRMNFAFSDCPAKLGGTSLLDALLAPTRIYAKAVLELASTLEVLGIAHITGGGLIENPPRMLKENLSIRFASGTWPRPPIFDLIQESGPVDETEMRRTFNLGLGMIICVNANNIDRALASLRACGESAHVVGEVIPRENDAIVFA